MLNLPHCTYFYEETVSLSPNISFDDNTQAMRESCYNHRYYRGLPLIVAHVMGSTICLPVVRMYDI
jgi:hypothetical protein